MKLVKRENPDVVVIGGSSVGLETAYYLVEKGIEVTVIEGI